MTILVFAEQRDNKFKKPAFEAVRTARSLADQLGGEVVALVVGGKVGSIAPSLGGYGAHKVVVVEDPKLALYASVAYAKLVAETALTRQATVVIIPATALGKDLAPRVAVKLNAGLASDCTEVRVVVSAVKVFTLRPNVFSAGEVDSTSAPVETSSPALTDKDFSCFVKEVKQSSGKLDVAEADIIVTGGRGLRGPENFAMIEQLADALGAAVGASRAVVDAGWRPHEEQVGQTGKTVSPSLYMAVAVSGAIQHLAGMSSSKYIVAINKDKDAPIFQVATYGIVGDAFEVVPALTAEVKKLLGKS